MLVLDYGATAAVISADTKNFESTLSKMMKGKKTPKKQLKQNSRAPKLLLASQRAWYSVYFSMIMKHSGLLIPTQLHVQLVVLINVKRLTLFLDCFPSIYSRLWLRTAKNLQRYLYLLLCVLLEIKTYIGQVFLRDSWYSSNKTNVH